MFKHFIGKIYLLDEPPKSENTQLDINFPDEILGDIDEQLYKESLTDEQVKKIIRFKEEMYELLGKSAYDRLMKENSFQASNSELIKQIALDLKNNPQTWNGLGFLNSGDVSRWDHYLFRIINFLPGKWDAPYGKFVAFIKVLSNNWTSSIPELLAQLDEAEIDIDLFFKLERNVSFKLASLLADFNELQMVILNTGVDLSPFISRLSHAFLPSVVYQLEEYGLPRMISRKLFTNGLLNFQNEQLTVHAAIEIFQRNGLQQLLTFPMWSNFEKYILEHFYDGITLSELVEN